MGITWPDDVDAIIGGDLAAGFAYVTPARGVVIAPMAPLGLRDRDRGTVTVTTSLGLWRKLDRIRSNPSVAIAFHARDHGDGNRPEFVLVQGTARFSTVPDRAWLESINRQWEHFLGPVKGGMAGRWLDVYYWQRVAIEVEVRRVVVWPSLACDGEPSVHGEPLPPDPPSQSPPKNGTGPRQDAARLAREAGRLPHTVLGWVGGDGLPMVVSVSASGAGAEGASLLIPDSVRPPGARRAGLTAHAFAPRMIGQEQRIYTGWLEVGEDGRSSYAPHTRAGYKLPRSQALFVLAAGAGTRAGIRKARERGLVT
jgi:hypothetical protein